MPQSIIEFLPQFLTKLSSTSGALSVEKGVATFPDGEAFDLGATLQPAYIVVQQGGSSGELYVHSHRSVAEAVKDRKSCAEAAYMTSAIIEVPAVVAALGETFYEAAEAIVEATTNLGYPEN